MKTVYDFEVALECIIDKYTAGTAEEKALNAAVLLAGRVLSDGNSSILKDQLKALVAAHKDNALLHADMVESVHLISEAVILGVKLALAEEQVTCAA